MKRSEMIKHIKACFRATDNMVEYQNGEISLGRCAENLAKLILNHIESKGMLPPPNSNVDRHTAYNYRHWESEDD